MNNQGYENFACSIYSQDRRKDYILHTAKGRQHVYLSDKAVLISIIKNLLKIIKNLLHFSGAVEKKSSYNLY